MTPITKIIEALDRAGAEPRRVGNVYRAKAVCHGGERKDSLKITERTDGKVCVTCFAEDCDIKTLAKAIGLTAQDFYPDDNRPQAKQKSKPKRKFNTLEAAIRNTDQWRAKDGWTRRDTYEYHDADGHLVNAVARYERPGKDHGDLTRDPPYEKVFSQFSVQTSCQWTATGMRDGKPLWRLPELKLDDTVVVMEGETAAKMAALCGINATTSAGGCKVPHLSDWTPLARCDVVLVADNDREGAVYALKVMEKLLALGSQCRFITSLPNVPPKGDFVDWCKIALGDAAEPEDFYVAFWTVVANEALEVVT